MGLIPEWFDANISSVALMGPCTSPNPKYFLDVYTEENMSFMEENGIYVSMGPNWESDKAKIMADGPESLKDFASTMEGLASIPV